tara:strand:+ start:123362 stop:123571 length:210 start_codon:yes stop_codon:yes gene_type:complete
MFADCKANVMAATIVDELTNKSEPLVGRNPRQSVTDFTHKIASSPWHAGLAHELQLNRISIRVPSRKRA